MVVHRFLKQAAAVSTRGAGPDVTVNTVTNAVNFLSDVTARPGTSPGVSVHFVQLKKE